MRRLRPIISAWSAENALGFNLQQEAVLRTLTSDVLKSSDIEGENLDAGQVRSSIARRLRINIGGLKAADRHVEGIVEMMLDATRGYENPLTENRLFDWHASLFPTARSGMTTIRTGAWRDDSTGAMQVFSGSAGKEHAITKRLQRIALMPKCKSSASGSKRLRIWTWC